ncbi:MAG: transglycosylase SLT domain-containing protein [Xanthomonadales bacterium]|nr:transglycosylase SLT domain-containing protein [Xanthomonadales bacterium]
MAERGAQAAKARRAGRLALALLAGLAVSACQSPGPTRPAPIADEAPAHVEPALSRPGPAPMADAVEAPVPAAAEARSRPRPSRPANPPPAPSTWEVLRAGFVLPGCDYAPATATWTRRYAGHPRRFAQTLDQMLPALDWTARRFADSGLPTELALLPIVESHFRPHPAPQARPAGIWQMIADTARSAGVRIDPWFDGRLNLAASTAGAIVLFDRYLERFEGDWRLALIAYNAGEYRVRRALTGRPPPGPAFSDLAPLELPSASMDYIARLLALACLVRDPERFDLDLPSLEPERRLVGVELDGVAGSGLARALSGLPRERFEQVNAGMLRGRTPPAEPFTLLVRQDRAESVPDLLARIPARARMQWHRRRLADGERLESLGAPAGVPWEVLTRLNDMADGKSQASGRSLWLPGPERLATAAADRDGGVAVADDPVHVVRAGDSLWSIARRHGLTVADLLRYNRLEHSRIRPGQRLLLQPP